MTIENLQTKLYGADDEEGIVGVAKHAEDSVLVWKRQGGEVVREERDFKPFAWVSDEAARLLEGGPKVFDLQGPGELNHLAVFDEYNQVYRARRAVEDELGRDHITYLTGADQQYLAQTGKTLFKGMMPGDIHRMQVDIEVWSEGFPNADRPEDEIIIISMCDNRGWERVLHTSQQALLHPDHEDPTLAYCQDEEEMIIEFIKWIHRRDPDVLEGHNCLDFDFPYLRDRANLYDINFALGRNNREPKSYGRTKEFAERDIDYVSFDIAGRHIIDTMFLAIDYDVYKRDLPGVGLKDVARHFGVSPNDRTYVQGDEIAYTWDTDPIRLLKYALDDVYETRGVSDVLMNSTFYLTQIFPMQYQGVMEKGTAGAIEVLMLREYLRRLAAVPNPSEGDNFAGGYTDIFQRGVFTDCVYADVASLYPSIMLNYGIHPDGDHLHLFEELLLGLTDMRLDAKAKMNALPEGPERSELDSRQSSYKILINSFYGMLGHRWSRFNDMSEADRVTATGRQLLKWMINVIQDLGGEIVLCDTDGVMFQLPESGMSDEEVDDLIGTISERMPPGINVDNDGRFERVLSYRKKNYIKIPKGHGIGSDQYKLKITGGSFKSRGTPQFGLDYIQRVAEALIHEDVEHAAQIHMDAIDAIREGQVDVENLAQRATLRDSLEEYDRSVAENPNKHPMAQYELAKELRSRGKDVRKGDIMRWYVAGDKAKSNVTAYEDAKLLQDYQGDENRAYYLDKLNDWAEKFEPFFRPEDFRFVFPKAWDMPDLFAKDPRDIEIVTTRLKSEV